VKKTSITGSHHGCHLRRRDIEELIFPSCRDVGDTGPTISTKQDNVEISGKTLLELEEEAEHPQTLNNIIVHTYANDQEAVSVVGLARMG
jgi:hypothetical protein